MKNKFVSIIVPCFNQAKYLDECLDSVVEQTFTNWECIIVNDGSQDHTEQVAQQWLKKDSRFKYINQKNLGLCAARNSGIEIAKGEFILPLDADDKISSKYIDLVINAFINDSSLKLVYCQAKKFGEENGIWNLGTFSLENLAKSNMIFCSSVFRKLDWQKVGGFDVNMIYGLEDWEFWIAILKHGGNVKKIDQVGFFYRVKKESMVTSFKQEQLKYLYEYMSVKHVDFFVKHLGSFKSLLNKIAENEEKMNSEKFIINQIFRRLLGFKIFKM